MKLSIGTIRNAVLFQNGAIGDFLMSIFLAEMLQKSGYVDHVTIIVPRNLNFLQGLIESYSHISIVEISRRRDWVQLLIMTQGPTLVIIQPTVGTIPLKVKFVAWLLSRRRGSEYVGFPDKAPSARRYFPRPLFTTPIGSTARICKASSARSGLRCLVQVPDLRITPDFKRVQTCGWIKGVMWFFIQVLQFLNDLLPFKLRET